MNHINAFKTALNFKTIPTQETYFVIINKYLTLCKGDINRTTMIEFLGTFTKNSILVAFYALNFFCRVSGIPFEITRKEISPKGVKKVREMLTVDEVNKLIHTVKNEFGMIEIGYIAMCTTYGSRRVELYDMNPDDIDIENKRIKIYIHKEVDEVRNHIIPDEIFTEMKDFKEGLEKVKTKPVITALNHMFDFMCEKSGIEIRPRLGFHSIRRILLTTLRQLHIDDRFLNHFLGWKGIDEGMVGLYTQFDTPLIDKEIFAVHPFLEAWKDGKNNE